MNTKHVKRILINILFVIFLCGSCHTYKEFDTSEVAIEKNRKYKIRTTKGDTFIMYVTEIRDSTIIGKYRGANKEISAHEIRQIRKGKFSPLKTFVVLPVSIVAAGIGYLFLVIRL